MSDDAVQRVYEALAAGELSSADLTTRRLSAFVGKTTSVLYHHWGSLDGFLHAVAQRGYRQLAEHMRGGAADGSAPLTAPQLADLAEAFVAFGLDHPALYHLMFERPFDWEALRATGVLEGEQPGLSLWDAIVAGLRRAGAREPATDARLLYAGLHGLVSLAASGRANVRALPETDRGVAMAAARELVRRILPAPPDDPNAQESER